MKTYRINEIFYSIQGEGMRAGEASIFIRFAGCNHKCTVDTVGFDCDTDFKDFQEMTYMGIKAEILKCASPMKCRWVVFTGGEPALQLDSELIGQLRDCGFKLAIETNGTCDITHLDLDWVTISPKSDIEFPDGTKANEVKCVIREGQALPQPRCIADHLLLSPASVNGKIDPSALNRCINLVKNYPEWRLSVQQHKQWGIR